MPTIFQVSSDLFSYISHELRPERLAAVDEHFARDVPCRPADIMRQAALVSSEPGWEHHLLGMVRYAQNGSDCRRSIICRSGSLSGPTILPQDSSCQGIYPRANGHIHSPTAGASKALLAAVSAYNLLPPCRHFAEPPAACAAACDVCSCPTAWAPRDISAEARAVIQALSSVPTAEKRLTLLQLIERWRASKVTPNQFRHS